MHADARCAQGMALRALVLSGIHESNWLHWTTHAINRPQKMELWIMKPALGMDQHWIKLISTYTLHLPQA